jgi:hypothetical protein
MLYLDIGIFVKSAYEFDDFKSACKQGLKKVIVSKDAEIGARKDFNLTCQALLRFIGNDGLTELELYQPKPWENNPDKSILINVDSYGFYTGDTYGYIAFLFSVCKIINGILNPLKRI